MGSTHRGHRLRPSQQWDTEAGESGISHGSKSSLEKADGRERKSSVKSGESKGSDSSKHLDWSDPSTRGR